MNSIYDIIAKKRHGGTLTDREIRDAVAEYTNGNVPDYQMSALLMAICCNGMDGRETATLTDAIATSGEMLDLSSLGELSVDKHSTGGVGDKTTLVAIPIAAALGCKIAKMSGRGLGHTGGTVDKLESIDGFRTTLTKEEFISQVQKIGVAVIGQSENLAPADKKIYALRDVTATVDSIPLITSSVMGKKLASGAHSIVLDVKYGSGSFMKTVTDAERLARNMVEIGKRCGRRTAALITDMDTPLGECIGNILEVKEAIKTLHGAGPSDLYELSVELAAMMAHLSLGIPHPTARERAEEAVKDGSALATLRAWVEAQGGNGELIAHPDSFPEARYSREVSASADGYIGSMNAERIGLISVSLGAGREKKGDPVDYAAGIVLKKKTGDRVRRGEVVATLLTDRAEALEGAAAQFSSAYTVTDTQPEHKPLIHEIIT